MIRHSPVVKLKIIVPMIAFSIGMCGNTQGAALQSIDNSATTHPAELSEVLIAETDLDAQQLLAMNMESAEDQEEMLELLAVLEEETEIATKTKMNNDYVPGMVTMLHGEQLEALGVHTVAEALAMVPGIQLARLVTGEPVLKVRGIAFPFNAGNVKVMLNSIALSRETSGINSSILLTPVAQVDRIEVIRGPGSSIYGDFAMGGVINIITKSTGGRLFARGGDDESMGGGGHYTYQDDEHSLSLGLNISMIDDGNNVTALNRDPDEERFTGVFNLDYKNSSFTAEGVRRSIDYDRKQPTGATFPQNSVTQEERISRLEESWAMEGRQTIEIGSADLEAYLSYLNNSQEAEAPTNEFQGDRMETGLDLNWSPWSAHQLHFGLSYTYADIDDAVREMQEAPLLEVSGVEQSNFSLSIQDMIAISDRFSLTLGLRFDEYDYVGYHLSPRIAGVYRLGDHHVVKAQYSEGFRAPTFWERYQTGSADDSLDFEVIETTELAYIYRQPNSVGRVTFYYSDIDDGLYRYPSEDFGNTLQIDSKGVELEWEQQINEKFRWLANVSYNDTSDGRYPSFDNESLGVTDWLGNLTFFLQPLPKLMLTGHLLHVGDRHATDGWVDGYDSVDLTLSRTDFLQRGVTLRGGVKNIFDDTITYLSSHPTGLNENEFQGRTWWLQLSYDF